VGLASLSLLLFFKAGAYFSTSWHAELIKTTKFRRQELYVLFARFKALCVMSETPEGIQKEVFKKGKQVYF